MPATSKAQRRLMAIAEHAPEKVRAANRGVLAMSKSQLSDFASTPEKGLPMEMNKRKGKGGGKKGKKGGGGGSSSSSGSGGKGKGRGGSCK
jgi:hypothetical protein